MSEQILLYKALSIKKASTRWLNKWDLNVGLAAFRTNFFGLNKNGKQGMN